jgi:hypothetical protein
VACANPAKPTPKNEPEVDVSVKLQSIEIKFTGQSSNLANYDPNGPSPNYVVENVELPETGDITLEATAVAAEGCVVELTATKSGLPNGDGQHTAHLTGVEAPSGKDLTKSTMIRAEVYKAGDVSQKRVYTFDLKGKALELESLEVIGNQITIPGSPAFEFDSPWAPGTLNYYVANVAREIDGGSIKFKAKKKSGYTLEVYRQRTEPIAAGGADGDEYTIATANQLQSQIMVEFKLITQLEYVTYTVTMTVPRSSEGDNPDLLSLKASFTQGGATVIPNFNKETFSGYNVRATERDGQRLYFEAQAESTHGGVQISAKYRNVSVTGTTLSVNKILTGSVPFPSISETNGVVLYITVTQGDGQGSKTWQVTLLPYSLKQVRWKGNATYTGSDKVIKQVTARNADLGPMLTDIETRTVSGQSVVDWHFDVNEDWMPHSFLVTLEDPASGIYYESAAIFPDEALITASKPVAAQVAGEASLWGESPVALSLAPIAAEEVGNRISSANEFYEKLGGAGGGVSENYSLACDINLEDYRDSNSDPVDSWEGPEDYRGHFYGNGYTITGLKLKPTAGARNLALFKSLGDGAVVENFSLEAETSQVSDVESLEFGGIVGWIDTGGDRTIRNVNLTGNFEFGTLTNSWFVIGGIVAEFSHLNSSTLLPGLLTIENCSVDMTVRMNSTRTALNRSNIITVGGIMSSTRAAVTISNCRANVDVQMNMANNQKVYIGGILGMRGANSTVTISNCYSTGDIVLDNTTRTGFESPATDVFVGGLVGGKRAGETAASFTMENCATLVKRTLAIVPAGFEACAYVDRVYGGDSPSGGAGTVSLSNNYALKDMRIGKTAGTYPGTASDGTVDGYDGLGKTEAQFKQSAIWKTGGLGWSDAIWDFDGLTKTGAAFYWPRLR